MIKFIKKLLGFKPSCACPSTPKETVREILTPEVKAANKKVKAVSAPITEGSQRTNVKRHAPNGKRPPAPKSPIAKKK